MRTDAKKKVTKFEKSERNSMRSDYAMVVCPYNI